MRKAQSGFYPKLGTAGRFGYVSNTMFFQGLVYGADVNFSIPFFQDVAAARAQVDQARAQQRSAESALREVSTGLELQVRAALARFEELRREIAVANENFAYRREKYDVTSSGYEEQMTTFSDPLDEQAFLSEADLSRYQALYSLQVAKAELDRLLGRC